jgi:hypothetical protein
MRATYPGAAEFDCTVSHTSTPPAISMLTLTETDRVTLQTQGRTNMSIRHLTRLKVIQAWFAAILLVGVTAIAMGTSVTIGTAVELLALCLVPPAIVLRLWPSDNTSTMAESIRNAKAR